MQDPGAARRRAEWAVLFDLDDTLVQTQQLKALRLARDWPKVYAAFGESWVLPGTREMLSTISVLAQTGVVTMAPRTYAERLLQHHALNIEVVIAYHDVVRRKPDPEPILKAAQLLGLRADHVIYVGDEERDVVAATRAGAHAIAFGGALKGNPAAAAAVAFASDWTAVCAAVSTMIDG